MKKQMMAFLIISMFIYNESVIAQTDTNTSNNNAEQTLCNNLAKSAASQIETRIKADNISVPQPQSVFSLSCLNGFFSGAGINIFSNVINPANIVKQITSKICSAVDETWQSVSGSMTQCGLTASIPDIGFNGINLGFGSLCSGNVNVGGNGTQVGSVGVDSSIKNSTNANPTLPTGYGSEGSR